MRPLEAYRGWVLAVILLFIITEIIWSWRREKKVYEIKDTITNLIIFTGFQLSKILFTGYQLAIMSFAAGYSLFTIQSNAATFLLTFILADFIYYWFHRVSHIWKPLWAVHHVHHSSTRMNLTAAYRLNWFSAIVSPVFFVPLAVLGLPINFIVASYVLNLLYQFFLHTEAVGIIKPIEGVIDTPSAHRVHHGRNPVYIDKNFGGVLMIWDRLFGTYQPETEKVIYGITGETGGTNPFKLVLGPFLKLFKGALNSKG